MDLRLVVDRGPAQPSRSPLDEVKWTTTHRTFGLWDEMNRLGKDCIKSREQLPA